MVSGEPQDHGVLDGTLVFLIWFCVGRPRISQWPGGTAAIVTFEILCVLGVSYENDFTSWAGRSPTDLSREAGPPLLLIVIAVLRPGGRRPLAHVLYA